MRTLRLGLVAFLGDVVDVVKLVRQEGKSAVRVRIVHTV
jgi:hypothetical protein